MKFRPCIDIHNGKIKQIVGGSLLDKGDHAEENFVSVHDGSFYGKLYRKHRLSGGHIIILNPKSSEYYDADVREALAALREFPGGLQVGGGITDENASFFIKQGASHVIVTSYVFSGGLIRLERLRQLSNIVGREHLVLDFSCRKKGGEYYRHRPLAEVYRCYSYKRTLRGDGRILLGISRSWGRCGGKGTGH